MKKLELKDHDSEEELKKEIRATKNGRYELRLRTVLMLKQGYSPKAIKEILLISGSTYAKWIKQYNEEGKERLKKHGSGRKEGNPKWDQRIFESLMKKLDLMEEYWSVPKMQKWIEEEYGVEIPDATIEYHLHKNNYSWKTNRPSPYKGDKKQQERFKKRALKKG